MCWTAAVSYNPSSEDKVLVFCSHFQGQFKGQILSKKTAGRKVKGFPQAIFENPIKEVMLNESVTAVTYKNKHGLASRQSNEFTQSRDISAVVTSKQVMHKLVAL